MGGEGLGNKTPSSVAVTMFGLSGLFSYPGDPSHPRDIAKTLRWNSESPESIEKKLGIV